MKSAGLIEKTVSGEARDMRTNIGTVLIGALGALAIGGLIYTSLDLEKYQNNLIAKIIEADADDLVRFPGLVSGRSQSAIEGEIVSIYLSDEAKRRGMICAYTEGEDLKIYSYQKLRGDSVKTFPFSDKYENRHLFKKAVVLCQG